VRRGERGEAAVGSDPEIPEPGKGGKTKARLGEAREETSETSETGGIGGDENEEREMRRGGGRSPLVRWGDEGELEKGRKSACERDRTVRLNSWAVTVNNERCEW
jgi:hypothetical protein